MWDPLRPKHPKKIQKHKYVVNPPLNPPSLVNGSAGGYKTLQKLRVYLSKTVWTLGIECIWGDKLETACVSNLGGWEEGEHFPSKPRCCGF